MIEPSCKMSVEDVATHYNDLDRYYREVWGEHLHHGLWTDGKESPEQAVQELVRLLANQAKIGPGDQVCDVGCGYGATARQLVDEYEAQVLGVTVSESQLEYALGQSGAPDEKLHGQARDVNSPSSSSPPAGESPNPRYRLQNWESNDFENRSFDAVVSIECLAHVVDKQKYFSEIFRVLKPGKHAAITAWLSGEDPTDWHVRHLLEPICREGRLASMGTAREYEKMISAAGLELVKFQVIRPLLVARSSFSQFLS